MAEAKRKVIYVSFYTDAYEPGAKKLKADLERLSIPHDLRHIKHKWTWQQAVRYKPQFILEMLRAHPEADAIVWVDSDAEVHKPSPVFYETIADLGVYFRSDPRKGAEELLSGTMYWKNTFQVQAAIEKWIAALRTAPEHLKKPEQQILQDILPKLGLTVQRLQREDCWISRVVDPRYKHGRIGPRIQHHQWSRQFRYDNTPKPVEHLSRSRRRMLKHPARKREKLRVKMPPPTAPLKDIRKTRRADETARLRRAGIRKRREDGQEATERAVYARAVQIAQIEQEAARQDAEGDKPEEPQILKKPALAYPPAGGLTGGTETDAEIRRAVKAMKAMRKAEELDRECSDRGVVVVVGEARSICSQDLSLLNDVPTVSCNRILRHSSFQPNYLIMGDREPYCQERDEGRLAAAAANGVKILLSNSIFDPRIHLSPRKGGPEYAKAQPPPQFPIYLFRFGPGKDRTWNYNDIVAGTAKLPFNCDSFKQFIVTCQNISGAMLQTAAILGAKVIGCVGIELKWQGDDSHHYGDGSRVGAWAPGTRTIGHIVASFNQAKQILQEHGIKVFNLSPTPNTPFSTVWKPYPYKKFVEKYCQPEEVDDGRAD